MASRERKPLERELVWFFSNTLAPGVSMQTRLGLATTPGIDVKGYRRLMGYVHSTAAPAAGFPRIRMGSDGTNIDEVFLLAQDLAQPNFEFPFDVPCYGDYAVLELTNGAGGATARAFMRAFPEGSGPAILGGSTPPSSSGNTNVTVFGPAAVAAGANNGGDQINTSWKGAVFAVIVTNYVAGGITQLLIQANYGGAYTTLYTFNMNLVANGQYYFYLYPATAAALAGFTSAPQNGIIPVSWRVQLTGAGGSNLTGQVVASMQQ